MPVVQFDYACMVTPNESAKHTKKVDSVPKEHRTTRPILAMVNKATGDGKAVILPSKATTEKYGQMVAVKFLEE